MNRRRAPLNPIGYSFGFLSGLVVGLAPALATWDGELAGLVPRVVIGAITAHTGGAISAR